MSSHDATAARLLVRRSDLAQLQLERPCADADVEGFRAVLHPLFATAFLIDDFLAAWNAFAARTLLLSSASSKTAFATAFCLTQRPQHATRFVGLTSAVNAVFARSLGCHDEVLDYGDSCASLPADSPTLHINLLGLAWAQGGAVHCPDPCSAAQRGTARWLRPQQLAAMHRRSLGRFTLPGMDPVAPSLHIEHARGEAAVRAVYQRELLGRSDPRVGHMLAL